MPGSDPKAFNAATGQVVHGAAVADPSAGATVDTALRSAVASVLAALRAAGVLAGASTLPSSATQFDGTFARTALLPAIAAPSGGATIDAEGRTAVGAVLNALRAHGVIAGATTAPSLTALSMTASGQLATAAAVADPAGGATVDAQARSALVAALAAMRSASMIGS